MLGRSELWFKATERQQRQYTFIRLCRDSHFSLDFVRAAHLAASMLKCTAFDIYLAFPYLGVMEEIASGQHPRASDPLSVLQPERVNLLG